MESLALICEHLLDLNHAWRAVLSLYIYSQHVLPVIQMLLDLEEDRPFMSSSPERRKQVTKHQMHLLVAASDAVA